MIIITFYGVDPFHHLLVYLKFLSHWHFHQPSTHYVVSRTEQYG